MKIIPPLAVAPVVLSDGTMNNEMRSWTENVSALAIITGTGPPEGVEPAAVAAMYMDNTGSAGSILYIKRDDNIGGDITRGWVLV